MTAAIIDLPRPGSTLLSDFDRRAIALLADGLTIKSAARRLDVNPGWLGTHLARLAAKTGTSNGTHLVATALRSRWITAADTDAAAA